MKTVITIILILLFRFALSAQNFWQEIHSNTVQPNSLDVSSTGDVFVIWDYSLLRSTNNGQTWDSLYEAPAGVSNFCASPTGPIYLSWDSLRKSTDEGNSWTAIVSPFYPVVNLELFTTNQLGYIFIREPYYYGSTFRSTDEGNSWDLIGFDSSAIVDIAFRDELTFGAFHGNDAGLYKSLDHGINWEFIPTAPSNLSKMFSTKSGKLLAFGGYPSENLYISTDDGLTWSTISEFNGIDIRDIEENQIGQIFLATLNGVYRSTDNGDSWEQINSGLDTNHIWCQRLCVDSSGYVYVTSRTEQTLYRSVESTTGVETEQETIQKFSLEQNYPNPFNPSTKIKFSIPSDIANEVKQSQLVSLKVYDVLGNEIEILVNEEKLAGSYELTWYAGQLSSGIYFYQLKVGEFVQTKKMILMK